MPLSNSPSFGSGRPKAAPSWWIALACIVFVIGLLITIVPHLSKDEPNPMTNWAVSTTNFQLVDDKGTIVSNRSWPGKFLLVYFGYTHCPDLCPTTLSAMAQALNLLGSEGKKVQPLFITIDPERDTPALMKQYTALFSSRITGLTGTSDQIADAADTYGVHFARQPTRSGDYEIAHSASVYLVYPSGALAMTIPSGETAQAIAADIEDRIP
jgi:protein SCO1/2